MAEMRWVMVRFREGTEFSGPYRASETAEAIARQAMKLPGAISARTVNTSTKNFYQAGGRFDRSGPGEDRRKKPRLTGNPRRDAKRERQRRSRDAKRQPRDSDGRFR